MMWSIISLPSLFCWNTVGSHRFLKYLPRASRYSSSSPLFYSGLDVVDKCSALHSEPCGCSASGLGRSELAFGLQPILQFRARLSSALQINLVSTLFYFLLTRRLREAQSFFNVGFRLSLVSTAAYHGF